MKKYIIFLVLITSVIIACNNELSYNKEEVLSFDTFSTSVTNTTISPSEKIKLDGTSMSLLHSAKLVAADNSTVGLNITAILSNTEAELKVPIDSIIKINYDVNYDLQLKLKNVTEEGSYTLSEPLKFHYLNPKPYDNVVESISIKRQFEIAGKDIFGIQEVSVYDMDNNVERKITEFVQSNTALSFAYPPLQGDMTSVVYRYYNTEGLIQEIVYAENIELVKEKVEIGNSLDGKVFTPRSVLKIEGEGALNMDIIDEAEFEDNGSVYPADIIFQAEEKLHVMVPQEMTESPNATLRLKYYDSELKTETEVQVVVPAELPNITLVNDYFNGIDDDQLSTAAGSFISYEGENLSHVKACYLSDDFGNELQVNVDASSTATKLILQLPYVVNVGEYKLCRLIYEDATATVYDYLTDAKLKIVGNSKELLFFDEGREMGEYWTDTNDGKNGAVGYFDADGNPIPHVYNPGKEPNINAAVGNKYMGFRWNPTGGTKGTKLQTYMFYGRFGHPVNDPPFGLADDQKYLYFYYRTGAVGPPRLYLTLYNNGLYSGVPSFSAYNFSTDDVTEVPKKDGWVLCCVDLSKIDMRDGGLNGLRSIRYSWIKFTDDTPDCEAFMDRMMISDRVMPDAYMLN